MEQVTAETNLPAVIVVNPADNLTPPTAKALDLYRKLSLAKVDSAETAASVGVLVKDLRGEVKAIEAYIKPTKEAQHAAWKSVVAFENETVAPFNEVANKAQGLIDGWLRAEHQRKEEERKRLELQLAQEAANERKQLEESAAALEELGQGTAAAELREEAERVVAAPAFVPVATGTVRGEGATVSATKKLVVEVTDKKKFLRYLVEQNSEAVFVEFKKSLLDSWVKSQGLKPGQVPGLHIDYTVKSSIR